MTDAECEQEYWAHFYLHPDHWDDDILTPEETGTIDQSLEDQLREMIYLERGVRLDDNMRAILPNPVNPDDYETVEVLG